MMIIINTLIAIVAMLFGAGICYLIFRYTAKGILRKAEEEAEVIKKNKIISENYSFGKIIYSRRPVDEVVNELESPFIVMFSCSVWNMEYNKTVAQEIKAVHPGCLILFGGHNISPDGKDLEKYDYVDFLVHRFGEEPTEGILEGIALEKDLCCVPNISYRSKEGKVITTKYEPQTKSDYPSPYLTGVFDDILNKEKLDRHDVLMHVHFVIGALFVQK